MKQPCFERDFTLSVPNRADPYWNNKYCGPGALSILTGQPVNRCAEAIRLHTGQKAVRGTHLIYMHQALQKSLPPLWAKDHTISVAEGWCKWGQRMSLKNFFSPTNEWVKKHPFDSTYLVQVTGHFVVVKAGKVADNKSNAYFPVCPIWKRPDIANTRVVKAQRLELIKV